MGSNTHEYLVVAREQITSALIEEGEGTGASEKIIERLDAAVQNLNRAIGVQRAILLNRSETA